MLAKVVTIALMCTIAGALGNINSKMLSDAISSYFEQSSGSTKDSGTLTVAEISRLLSSALILDEDKSVNAELLNMVSFFAKDVYAQATMDSEKLKFDLEQLKVKLTPYSGEVTKLLSKTTEELEITLNPYAEQLQYAVEKITLDFIKELKSIDLGLNGDMRVSAVIMKVPLVLYSQKLEAKVSESLTALRNAIATCTEKVREKIDLQILTLYQSLSPFAEDLQGTLRKHMENLNFLMIKSIALIERKIVDTTATLEKQITLCTSLLKQKNSLFSGNIRNALALCLYDISQKIEVFKDVVTPYREALTKSLVLHVENLKNLLEGSAAATLQDQKDYLEKKIFDKISDLLNGTLLTAVTGTVTE